MWKMALSLAIVLVAGCGPAGEPVDPLPDALHVQAGDTITLRYGAAARLGDSVRIVFRTVEADSRCPVDVNCVWEGDAAIRIDAASGTGAWQPFVLHTQHEPKSARHGGFVVELIDVQPLPRQDHSIVPGDYSVRLAISRG